MRQQWHYAQGIHRVVAALSHRATAEDVADGLVREVADTLGAGAASVWLFDDERNRISLVRAIGYRDDILERWTETTVDSSPLLSAVRRGEAAFARTRLEDPRFDPALTRDFGDGAAFLVAMQAGGRVFGGLGCSFDHPCDFTPADCAFIVTLATHCAQSFERARLFEAERAARAAADAARRQLEAVLLQLPTAVSVVGIDGSVLVNGEAQSFYGLSTSRLTLPVGDHRAAVMSHLDGRAYTEAELPIVRALGGVTVTGEELLAMRADGLTRRLRVNAAPVRDEAGPIGSAVAAFTDITDESRVHDELRASQRRYHAVLRATNDVIWDFDAITNRLTWNGGLERLFGHRPEETNAHPRGGYAWWIEHIHPDDVPAVLEGYESAREHGADSWNSEYRFRRKDGTYVPALDRCVFERDESGRLVRVIGAISDMSEQRRLLDELRDAVLVRDDFLSCAGHELRTPLATLSAQLLGLKQLPLDETRRAHKLAAAERQVSRLTTLVDELLNVSRIVHGKLRLELERVDLAVIVHEAAARLLDDFQRGGTPLEIAAPVPVLGFWDRLRIDLVITNLLTNALRYGERRPVRVQVDAAGDRACVSVEDHGLGIRPEDQERIFERFVRAVPTRQFGGLGVGLWLSRQIVAAHGGRLRVESQTGIGSRFTAELPRGDA